MKKDSSDYLQWVERCVAELRESGRYGQSINYRKAGRSFARFLEENRRGRPSIREIKSCGKERTRLRPVNPLMSSPFSEMPKGSVHTGDIFPL